MAAYAVVDWLSTEGSITAVLAELETKLETLDSTTNTIRLVDVDKQGNGLYRAFMVYDG